MRPSGAMMTCASAEASSAWLRMSTRPASAVCIALAAKAAKPLITASAITVLVTAWALAPEMMSLAKSAPTKAPAAARRSAILPSRPIQPGCWRSNPQFAQRRAPSTSATMLRFRPLRVRLKYHGPAAPVALCSPATRVRHAGSRAKPPGSHLAQTALTNA